MNDFLREIKRSFDRVAPRVAISAALDGRLPSDVLNEFSNQGVRNQVEGVLA
jgi:hypothetical protein